MGKALVIVESPAKISQPSYKLSKELSSLLGKTELSRPQATKEIWNYIKAHNLQDPADKRMIRPDAALAKIFGSNKPVNMMKLAGILTKHLKK
jgi:chromatin remodeling complex protein RSC6